MRRALHNLLRRLHADERGIALVMAVGVTAVLAATATSVIAYTGSSFRQATHSRGDQIALSLAEAGLNNALATLYSSGQPNMATALPTESEPVSHDFPGVGRAEWYGILDATANEWTVVGVGYALSPSPETAGVVRRVSVNVGFGGSTRDGNLANTPWNYVYADDPTACTTLRNTSEVNVPLYVRGSLCLENSAKVTGYAVQVGGTVTILNSDASVGTADAPLTEAHIAGGCSLDGVNFGACSSATKVYADRITSSPTALTKPPVDMQYWYDNSMPGPRHGCTAGSLPGGFDNDTVMNRSRPEFDLTPREAYDCRVYDDAGNLAGQLSWDPATATLSIAGTIFFDGDIVMGKSSANAVYVGKATIYTSGQFRIAQQSSLCGVAGCTVDWTARENLLAIVAGASPGDSVTIENYSTFQGAVYAVGDYREGNNSTCWGPIIANRIYLQNSTLNHYVPIGTLLPGMPSTNPEEEAVTLQTPTNWSS